jgi:molybdopterin-guanine dinucleotide biosynthesis protein A
MANRRQFTAIIPCAGRSERFEAAGYNGGKALMIVDHVGRRDAMIGHVLRTLPFADRRLVIAGCRTNDYAGMESFQVRPVRIENSRGQSETILMCLGALLNDREDEACLVVNCDALISGYLLDRIIASVNENDDVSMACVVQESADPGMSYVDQVPYPTRFVEKQQISGYGMSGAWYFRSAEELYQAINYQILTRTWHGKNNEFYLSEALNYLPGRKMAWIAEAPREQIVDWNTPEALLASGARIIQ